jgi:hypothetical protein
MALFAPHPTADELQIRVLVSRADQGLRVVTGTPLNDAIDQLNQLWRAFSDLAIKAIYPRAI